jgi:hypothetical protein
MAVLAGIAVSLPRLSRLPFDFMRDKQVMLWVLIIAIGVFIFARLPHEAAYLLPVYPFGFMLMAKYFRTAVLVPVVAAVVLTSFVDLTTPGDEIGFGELAEARPGGGLILSNRDTMNAQIEYVRDIENYEIPENSVVSLGFVYPHFAVLNRDDLELGILEKDNDAISQLSDKGKADEPGAITYVWLLEYEKFIELRDQGRRFFYTLDAGRSTAALYEYRPGLFGGTLLDLGRSPSGGSGAARTDR